MPVEPVADEGQAELGDEEHEDERDVEDRADDGEDDPAGSIRSVGRGSDDALIRD